jgi:hypothetical protein
MSHIVQGKIKTAFKDEELLMKALAGLGTVRINEKLYRVGPGYTAEKYDIVLIDESNPHNRLGFNRHSGVFVQYQEEYGSVGAWTRRVSAKIQDRYIAFHYEKELVKDGFDVSIQEHKDGTVELLATEAGW